MGFLANCRRANSNVPNVHGAHGVRGGEPFVVAEWVLVAQQEHRQARAGAPGAGSSGFIRQDGTRKGMCRKVFLDDGFSCCQNLVVAMSSNLLEAANRAEATAILIRKGYKVYRPEADDQGEDLVLRTPSQELIPVQLKGRLHVERAKYGDRGMWMLFPCSPWDGHTVRDWFLVPHDELFSLMKERHGHAPGFAGEKWSVRSPARGIRPWLEHYRLTKN